jgi:hypothetical protein
LAGRVRDPGLGISPSCHSTNSTIPSDILQGREGNRQGNPDEIGLPMSRTETETSN